MNNTEIIENASKVLEAIDAAKEEELRNLNSLVQPRAPLNAGSTPGEIINEIKHLSTRDQEGGTSSKDEEESGAGRTVAEGAATRDHKYSKSRPKKQPRSGLQSGAAGKNPTPDGEGGDTCNRELDQHSDGDGHSNTEGASSDLASIQPCQTDDAPCSSTSYLDEEDEPAVRPKTQCKQSGLIESKEDEDGMLSELHEQHKGRSKRLSALGRVNSSPIPSPRPDELLKKGHRREYSMVWSNDGVFIESWCNPMCARIRPLPIREICVCGRCPLKCSKCLLDPE
ncbi:nonstructural protein V [Tupaia paramyxovirus]|uniref:Non-structural protein V n=1 Tax=Tupaia paramyxovirus TaxID=92129 RepID=V_TPMV|nr:nonstructural protein V [Tupaia paramyxovirus]Q9QM81.1 RecName: Full=Non-structural protein V [Tupaia paramyxovirus]AAD28696.2 nonstructural protein V [Tupaia paramyxovirus]